jgi:hypothetical protein
VFAVWIAETKSALKRTLLCHFLLVARTYSRDAEAFVGHAGNFSRQPPKRLGFATPPPFTPM